MHYTDSKRLDAKMRAIEDALSRIGEPITAQAKSVAVLEDCECKDGMSLLRAILHNGDRRAYARASGHHQLRKCTTPWWRLEPTRTLRNRPHSRCLRKAFSLNWCLENQMKAIRGAAAWETSACAPERCRPASSLARSLLAGNKCP
jgi:hypothetical protein